MGEPARMYPPGEAEQIRDGVAEVHGGFLPLVFGVDDASNRHEQMQTALKRYTRAMTSHHREDEIIPASADGG